MSHDERKEKVLHTRISDTLDDAIRVKAGRLGISVSNLVRNVLQNTFGLVEDIVADSANVARSARGGLLETQRRWFEESHRAPNAPLAAGPGAAPRAPQVLGWQVAILNLNAVCQRCNALLAKGGNAAIGICDQPGLQVIICTVCMEEVTHGSATAEPTSD